MGNTPPMKKQGKQRVALIKCCKLAICVLSQGIE